MRGPVRKRGESEPGRLCRGAAIVAAAAYLIPFILFYIAGDAQFRECCREDLTAGTVIRDVFASPVTQKSAMVVAAPLRRRDGQALGVLAAGLRVDKLRSRLLTRSAGRRGESFLVEAVDHVTLCHPRNQAYLCLEKYAAANTQLPADVLQRRRTEVKSLGDVLPVSRSPLTREPSALRVHIGADPCFWLLLVADASGQIRAASPDVAVNSSSGT